MPRSRPSLADDFAAARALIPGLAERSAALIAGVRDPRAASPLPGWTAGDVAVHLSLGCLAYASAAAGEYGDWLELIPERPGLQERITELNARALELSGPDDFRQVPELIVQRAEEIVAATAGRDPLDLCATPWFGDGFEVPLGTVLGLFMSETAVHTLDIARASRQAWHIAPRVARLIVSLVFPEMMPRMYDHDVAAGMTARVQLHIRTGITIGLRIVDGAISTERNPAGKADCHVSMDPVAFLLVGSGRSGRNREIAAGRMIPYGRKPWLAPRVSRLFSYP